MKIRHTLFSEILVFPYYPFTIQITKGTSRTRFQQHTADDIEFASRYSMV